MRKMHGQTTLKFPRQIFITVLNLKFYGNLESVIRFLDSHTRNEDVYTKFWLENLKKGIIERQRIVLIEIIMRHGLKLRTK